MVSTCCVRFCTHRRLRWEVSSLADGLLATAHCTGTTQVFAGDEEFAPSLQEIKMVLEYQDVFHNNVNESLRWSGLQFSMLGTYDPKVGVHSVQRYIIGRIACAASLQ